MMKMTVEEMARFYYPELWDINRLDQLVAAGKLSQDIYDEIVGKDSVNENAN